MKQINSDSKGQVMVIAVIIMVILMLGILFLFDLQNVIRSKVKIETADQAAALSAAQWQKESLNLIGELNLIKACDQLQNYGDRQKFPQDPDRAREACKPITEMQIRMSFVGPVIAFGAAQQAAKNNGVNIYDYQGQSSANVVKQVQLYAIDYYNNLNINTPTGELRYGDAYRNGIMRNGVSYYKTWWDDYRGMLKTVIDQGIAVRPNVRIGIERVTPYAFKDRVFYNAILNEWWCYFPLRSLLKQPDSYWSGKWWQNIQYDNPNFTGQSEIYSLGIAFAQDNTESSVGSYYDQVNNRQPSCWDNYLSKALGNPGQDWIKNTPGVLPQITWSIYDSSWDSARMDDIGSYWNRSQGGYLSGNIKPSVSYDGAVAYAECSQTINLVNSFESKMDEPTEAEAKASLKGNAPSPIRTRNDTIINKGVPVGNDSSRDGYPAGVIARALGELEPAGSKLKPPAAQIILPAFSNVALFPIAMFADNINLLRNTDDPLSAFIIWLKTADDLYNPSVPPPTGSQLYLQAVQKLDTESFRKSGFNNGFKDVPTNDAYFSDAYKYSATNSGGAGWLQQVYIFTNSDPKYTYDPSKQTVPDTFNPAYSRYYFIGSNLYIVIDSSGKARTNEQERCGNGYVPTPYSGPRSGPPRI